MRPQRRSPSAPSRKVRRRACCCAGHIAAARDSSVSTRKILVPATPTGTATASTLSCVYALTRAPSSLSVRARSAGVGNLMWAMLRAPRTRCGRSRKRAPCVRPATLAHTPSQTSRRRTDELIAAPRARDGHKARPRHMWPRITLSHSVPRRAATRRIAPCHAAPLVRHCAAGESTAPAGRGLWC